MATTTRLDDFGKLILRFAVAGILLIHGVTKLRGGIGFVEQMVNQAGLPHLVAYGVYAGEVIAPLLVIAGMLTRPAALARLGAVASLTRERCDGSGYHRGLTAPAIPLTARVLAAACAFRARTEPRPQPPALTAKQAPTQVRADARAIPS